MKVHGGSGLRLCFALMLCTMWISTAAAQKRTLIVRIDTITIKLSTLDTLVPVYYRLAAVKSPNFYGFDSRFNFDPGKLADSIALRPVDTPFVRQFFKNGQLRDTSGYELYLDSTYTNVGDSLMFYRTASSGIGIQLFATLPSEERAITLGQSGQGVNLKDSLLYRAYIKPRRVFSDTGWLTLFRFDFTSDTAFDSVIMQSGWIRYQHNPINVVSPNVRADTNGHIVVPITANSVSDAYLRTAKFTCTFDTTVMRYTGALPLGDSLKLRDSSFGNRIVMYLSKNDTSSTIDDGAKFVLSFMAVPRRDTVCTMLNDSGFQALNEDNLISGTTLTIGTICIDGNAESVNVGSESGLKSELRVWPNPFREWLAIQSPSSCEKARLVISDALGRQVVSRDILTDFRWTPEATLATGVYFVRLTTESTTEGVQNSSLPVLLIR